MRSTADQYCVPTVLPEYNQLSKTKRGGGSRTCQASQCFTDCKCSVSRGRKLTPSSVHNREFPPPDDLSCHMLPGFFETDG